MSQILKFGRNAAKGLTDLLSTKPKKPKTEGEKKTDSAFLSVCEGSKSETSRSTKVNRYARRPLTMPSASTSSESSASLEIPSHNFVSGEGTTELLSGEKPAEVTPSEVTPSNEEDSVHSSSETSGLYCAPGKKEVSVVVVHRRWCECWEVSDSSEVSNVEELNAIARRTFRFNYTLTEGDSRDIEHDLKKLGCPNPTEDQERYYYTRHKLLVLAPK